METTHPNASHPTTKDGLLNLIDAIARNPGASELITHEIKNLSQRPDFYRSIEDFLTKEARVDNRLQKLLILLFQKTFIANTTSQIDPASLQESFHGLFSMIVNSGFEIKIAKLLAESLSLLIVHMPDEDLRSQLVFLQQSLMSANPRHEQVTGWIISLEQIRKVLLRKLRSSKNNETTIEILQLVDSFSVEIFERFVVPILESGTEGFGFVSLFFESDLRETIKGLATTPLSLTHHLFNPMLLSKLMAALENPRISSNYVYNMLVMKWMRKFFQALEYRKRDKGFEHIACNILTEFYGQYASHMWQILLRLADGKLHADNSGQILDKTKFAIDQDFEVLRLLAILIRLEENNDALASIYFGLFVKLVLPNLCLEQRDFNNITDNPAEMVNYAQDLIDLRKSKTKRIFAFQILDELAGRFSEFHRFFVKAVQLINDQLLSGMTLTMVVEEIGRLQVAVADMPSQLRAIEQFAIPKQDPSKLLLQHLLVFNSEVFYIELGLMALSSLAVQIQAQDDMLADLNGFIAKNYQKFFQIPGAEGQIVQQRFYLFFMYTSSFILEDNDALLTSIILDAFRMISTAKSDSIVIRQILTTFSNTWHEDRIKAIIEQHMGDIVNVSCECLDYVSSEESFKLVSEFLSECSLESVGVDIIQKASFKVIAKLNGASAENPAIISLILNFLATNLEHLKISSWHSGELFRLDELLASYVQSSVKPDFEFNKELLIVTKNYVRLLTTILPSSKFVCVVLSKLTQLATPVEINAVTVFELLRSIPVTQINSYGLNLESITWTIFSECLDNIFLSAGNNFGSNLLAHFFAQSINYGQERIASPIREIVERLANSLRGVKDKSVILPRSAMQLLTYLTIRYPVIVSQFLSAKGVSIVQMVGFVFLGEIEDSRYNPFTLSNLAKILIGELNNVLQQPNSQNRHLLFELTVLLMTYNFKRSHDEFLDEANEVGYLIRVILQQLLKVPKHAYSHESDDEIDSEDDDDEDADSQDAHHNDKESNPSITFNLKGYLSAYEHYIVDSETFADEYPAFKGLIQQFSTGDAIGFNGLVGSLSPELCRFFKGLQSVSYLKIDGHWRLRKTLKIGNRH
jgi:hypothetical protein